MSGNEMREAAEQRAAVERRESFEIRRENIMARIVASIMTVSQRVWVTEGDLDAARALAERIMEAARE